MNENRSKTNDRVDFTQSIFDNQTYRNGTLFTLERAIFCPCRNIETNYIDPNCTHCRGTGWLYTEAQEVFGMVTNLNYQQTLQMSYEHINATANLTLSEQYDFRLRYFDKLTVKDGYGLLKNMNIRFSKFENSIRKPVFQANVPFQISQIEYMLILIDNKIEQLTAGKDFTFDNVTVTLSDIYRSKIDKLGLETVQATIRYYHYPIYHVLQDQHAIRMTRIIKDGKETPQLLPLQYLIREHSFFNDQGQPI